MDTQEALPFRAEIGAKEVVANVELVSLKTAALAEGKFKSVPIRNREYDQAGDRWRTRDTVSRFDVGEFDEGYVFGRNRWNIITRGGLYIEEIGYMQTRPLSKLESWQNYGARYTIRDRLPTLDFREMEGPFILLGGDNAFYHHLLNWLPRLMILDLFEHDFQLENLRFILADDLPENFLRSIIHVGVKREQLFPVKYNFNYIFPNLIVPRFFDNLSTSTFVIEWLRKKFLPSTNEIAAPHRLIYISRTDATKGAPRRRVVNEQDVLNCLVEFGFTPYNLSEISIQEQAMIFSEALVVVAPHGAALANLSFSRPGTMVLVFENESKEPFFATAFKCVPHQVNFIYCRDSVDVDYESRHPLFEKRHRDMLVDINELRTTIEALILKASP